MSKNDDSLLFDGDSIGTRLIVCENPLSSQRREILRKVAYHDSNIILSDFNLSENVHFFAIFKSY
jgi:hypothetical protein